MNILFLGYCDKELIDFITDKGDTVYQTDEKIDEWDYLPVEFIISYSYRYLIPGGVLESVPSANLHISYLPWNRGADPNFWSFKDNTPKGVTIHKMDEGIDTGPILAQKIVIFSKEENTFRKTYDRLQIEIKSLFKEYWHLIRVSHIKPIP